MQPEAKSYIDRLRPYHPGTPVEVVARRHGIDPATIVKLASNENPAGMSPKARQAAQAAIDQSHRYPDDYDLIQVLSQKHAVDIDQIILGNGSVDLLNMIAMAFLDERSSAVSSQYAFAIYRLVTQAAGAQNIIVPAADFGHDLQAMQKAITTDTKVVWIANPNNPTGTFIPYEELRRMLEAVRKDVLVVLDEAYYDYISENEQKDAVTWLHDFRNLILLRTFSKVYGMAGMRIGYALASVDIADALNRVRMPFNASIPALAGAVAALQDEDFIRSSVDVNEAGKSYLIREMQRLGLEILPANGNFVTVNIRDAADIYEKLERKGVIVRPLNGYDMPEWIRVTVGLAAENEAFIQALEFVIAADK